MKTIELHKSVTASNDQDANDLRKKLYGHMMVVNLMSSPGSGKTTLLSQTIKDMQDVRIGVMEADIESDVDALTIESLGAKSIQVHTDGMCHMDAGMTKSALEAMDLKDVPLVFLENVGNLICPAEFDTGATHNVMILSVPEGDDKPLKYPLMFEKSDALVITKKDTLDYFDFNYDLCVQRVRRLNPSIKIFFVSAMSGDGMKEWEDYLRAELKKVLYA